MSRFEMKTSVCQDSGESALWRHLPPKKRITKGHAIGVQNQQRHQKQLKSQQLQISLKTSPIKSTLNDPTPTIILPSNGLASFDDVIGSSNGLVGNRMCTTASTLSTCTTPTDTIRSITKSMARLFLPRSNTNSGLSSPDSGFGELEPLDLSIQSLHSTRSTHCMVSNQLTVYTDCSRSAPIKSELLNTNNDSSKPKSPSSVRVCPECNKQYESNSRFRAHLRRHESKHSGRYQCDVCFKNFVQRSSLKTHQRIHSGERPYHCLVCDERFGDFSTFTKHRRIHTGEKPYKCPVCSRRFSQSGNMHRHRQNLHRCNAPTKE